MERHFCHGDTFLDCHCILSTAAHTLILESQMVGTVPEMCLGSGIKKVEGILWIYFFYFDSNFFLIQMSFQQRLNVQGALKRS